MVGAGNSGAQIALELAESGRPTWLSGRDTGSIPRRVLGRDVYDWLWWTVMRPSIESWAGRRLMGNGLFAGDPLVGFSRRALMIPTLTSVGRTVGVANGHPRLEDGNVLEDVRAVVWCTGFRPDFRWIHLPVFGPEGYPNHRRGIVAAAPAWASLDCGISTGSARRCLAVCARMQSTSSDSSPRATRMPVPRRRRYSTRLLFRHMQRTPHASEARHGHDLEAISEKGLSASRSKLLRDPLGPRRHASLPTGDT